MTLVGLTGGIASGKSTVARMFSELGARVIDVDALAHRVMEPGRRAYKEVLERFGDDVRDAGGDIDREKLGRMVFSDESARKALEHITHPMIGAEILKEIGALRAQGEKNIIVEAPLLVEAGMHAWLRPFIVVSVDEETQIDRLIRRNGYSREEALRRVRAQMPIDKKTALADYTIDNSGDLDLTRSQVRSIWERIKE